jgi:uncharacterized protein (TIGR03067 family)
MKLGIFALSLTVVLAGQGAQDDIKKEFDKFQGNWTITMFNGQVVPPDAQAFLVFTGDKYEQLTNGTVSERGTIKLNPRTTPMSIDLFIIEGGDAGKTQPGVYELKADTLRIGLTNPGNTTRPSAIANAELQVVLTKAK